MHGEVQRTTAVEAAAPGEPPLKARGCSDEAVPIFKGTAAEVSHACCLVWMSPMLPIQNIVALHCFNSLHTHTGWEGGDMGTSDSFSGV